jgi:hypothetical protein
MACNTLVSTRSVLSPVSETFGNHVRFKPDELQGRVDCLVAAEASDRRGFLPDSPGIISSTSTRTFIGSVPPNKING